MASPRERSTALVRDVRARRPLVDHLVRMQEHYTAVKASQQAGAITYFGFLSVFPLLALAFFVVGWVAKVFPDAQSSLEDAINHVIPELVGDGSGQIQVSDIKQAAATIGLIGFFVLLYAGLGWLSAVRRALEVVFELPRADQPNFVFGKLRDLITLALIGVVLLVSVAVAGLVGGFSEELLDWLGVDTDLGWALRLVTVAVGLGADLLLFWSMFVLLAGPRLPRRALVSGALVGAIAFEVLKQVAGPLIAATQGNPAFQVFGLALIVLVWIYYSSRVILYAASWAVTAPAARALRVPAALAVAGPPSPPVRPEEESPWAAPYLAGALSTVGVMALVRRLTRNHSGGS
jgi:membrane protein